MAALIDTIKEVGTALQSVDDEKRAVLVKSLVQLVNKLTDKMNTLGDISIAFQEHHPVMEKQLLAIEKRTEKATDEIMEIAEALGADAAKLEGDAKANVQKHVNALFEVSGFQDLVAQHVIEVKTRVADVKQDMDALQNTLGEFGIAGTPSAKSTKKQSKRLSNDLLNGPSTDI